MPLWRKHFVHTLSSKCIPIYVQRELPPLQHQGIRQGAKTYSQHYASSDENHLFVSLFYCLCQTLALSPDNFACRYISIRVLSIFKIQVENCSGCWRVVVVKTIYNSWSWSRRALSSYRLLSYENLRSSLRKKATQWIDPRHFKSSDIPAQHKPTSYPNTPCLVRRVQLKCKLLTHEQGARQTLPFLWAWHLSTLNTSASPAPQAF